MNRDKLQSLQLAFVTLLSTCAVANGSDLAIEFKANRQTVAEIRLNITADQATATVAGETERFNLKEMSWLDERTSQWITITRCKEWADQSKAKTKKSADSVPAQVRPFLLWSLEPTFKVAKSNDTLRLTSGQVDYVIEGQASKTNVDGYFRYAVLNAYKKAMTEKKLPPFSELKAIEEMKTLGRIPRKISVTMPGIPGSPAIDLEITETKP
jgi:hypothetical protein